MHDEERQERISQAAQTALNLSHGVKNILQAIKGGREVMDYSFKMGDMVRAERGWVILKRNLDKIQKLVLDMLEYSRESSADIKPCNFNKLVGSAINTLWAEADKKGVTIELVTDSNLGLVQIDSDKMYDVVLNLVLNAIDAVSEGVGVVKVVTALRQDDETISLTVSDNGPGVEDMRAIWEPFHTTKSRIGTGLGLAISKKSVEQHLGTIEVCNQSPNGAVFTVNLPMKQTR